ncbi:MAG: ABC transporter permease [Candidatus Limnocylindrales bacterium]|jgi:ABC-2 type transport system permease protein/oleandomycin transport system permease protein
MTAGGPRTAERVAPSRHSALYWTVADSLVMARRQLIRIPRSPEELFIATLEPVLLVVAFRYIFGGAIAVPGTSYVNYLMGGMLVMAAMFGSYNTGVGVVTDLQRGLVDRFRSLPMARSAVLTGRVLADLARSAFIIVVVWAVGLLVGFRPEGTIEDWAAALALLLLCSFTLIWLSLLTGLLLSSAEAVQSAESSWFFLLIFISGAFVPTASMPDWLRPIAEHQPISVLIDAVRGFVVGQPDSSATLQATVWLVALLVLLIPLSLWAYDRHTAR